MAKSKETYHDRFIKAIRYWMADNNISELKEAAEVLKIPYINFYKVMNKANKPSVELCAQVCELGKFSAEWMFLGKGEQTLKLVLIANQLEELKQKINK